MHMTSFGTETQAYFPVSLQPVFVGDEGSQAPDFQAVVREDTGAVLGIHRGSYKLVPNQEIFEPFEEAIAQSGIALDGLRMAPRARAKEREDVGRPELGRRSPEVLVQPLDTNVADEPVMEGEEQVGGERAVLLGGAAAVLAQEGAE